MKIHSVYDPEFKAYGKVLEGYDTKELCEAMLKIDLPAEGVAYEPGIDSLEACAIFKPLTDRAYGGMPIQLGLCWGRNTTLNCLEYHRDSEINIGTHDFILILGLESQIVDGQFDTGLAKAFRAPAGVPVEVFATSLHYAPCHTDFIDGFRVAIVLPKGTNTAKPDFAPACEEDKWMTARNKWLLAHAEAPEAKDGAHIGLVGENLDVAADL